MPEPTPRWRQFWTEIERIFDPAIPVQNAALFAERPQQYNSMHRLHKRLRRVRGQRMRVLVAGTIGNGKTSELYHLADALSKERMVVFFDIWRHFERTVGDVGALERLDPWELIGLLGLAIYRAGTDRFGHHWEDEPKQLERALEALRKQEQGDATVSVDVPKLARGIVVAAGGVAGAVLGGPVGAIIGGTLGETVTTTGETLMNTAADATDWLWRIGQGSRKQRQDQEPEVRGVLRATNLMIMALQQALARPFVLIVDGIDRILNEDRLRKIFVDSSLLAELNCDVVVTGPEPMLHGTTQYVRDFHPVELCNIPVLDRTDPRRLGLGSAFFRDLVARRVAAVRASGRSSPPDPFPAEVIDRLAYYSGGIAREFVRMVHMAVGEAIESDAPAITLTMVDEVLSEFRGMKQQRMNVGEIALLRQVMDDPNHGLPADPMAVALLRQLRLLPYPNENPWYYPHPLLMLSLLKTTSGSAS